MVETIWTGKKNNKSKVEKRLIKDSSIIYKNLMKNPNWKSYQIGFNDGKKEGRVEALNSVEFKTLIQNAESNGAKRELEKIKLWIDKQAMCSFNNFSDKKQLEYITCYEVSELILKEIEKRLKELESKGVN